MKVSKRLFESSEDKLESILVEALEVEYKRVYPKFQESAIETVSKFMINHLPDRVMQMIPNITAVISKELSDTDINGILDKLLQDKETFQRIAQKLMDRLMNSRC